MSDDEAKLTIEDMIASEGISRSKRRWLERIKERGEQAEQQAKETDEPEPDGA